jgi:hypothetical protein
MVRLMLVGLLVVATAGCGKRISSVTVAGQQGSCEPRVGEEIRGKQLSESTARQLAEHYAIDHELIPQPAWSVARLQPDGNWLVTFYPKWEAGPWIDWSLMIGVGPTGRWCGYSDGSVSGSTRTANGVGDMPLGAITSDNVVLLARVFAEREGLMPTETTIKGSSAADGGWVFAFNPGNIMIDGLGSTGSLPPFCVYVNPAGVCILIDYAVPRTPCNAAPDS